MPPFGPTLLTWFLPGAGHVALGAWRTALVGFLVVQGLYLAGALLSGGLAFDFLDLELRGRFALVLTPEVGNVGALLAHQMLVPLAAPPNVVPPVPPPSTVHLGSWLTAASGILNIVLMAHAHLAARVGASRRVDRLALELVSGWLVPGAGHVLQGRTRRALVVAVTVVALFALGTLWAQGTNLSREAHFYYWSGQALAGLPAFAAEFARGHPPIDALPQLVDVGIYYACLAGLLNGLIAIDLFAWGESQALGLDPVEDRRQLAHRRRSRKERAKAPDPGASAARKHLVAPAAPPSTAARDE